MMKMISMAVAAMLGVSAVFAATDPRAGQPEGERIALWPEGKIPSFEEHDFKSKGATKGKFLGWRPLLWDWLVQTGLCSDAGR